jgi:hypothetical protein
MPTILGVLHASKVRFFARAVCASARAAHFNVLNSGPVTRWVLSVPNGRVEERQNADSDNQERVSQDNHQD